MYLERDDEKYPRLWLAQRWNQAVFSDVPGLTTEWDRDAIRADIALGLRLNEHARLKLQCSTGDKRGPDHEGGHLAAMQVTLRF